MAKLKELLQKVKKETLSFQKHPCREIEEEMRIHYLNGLALMAMADDHICDKEKEYLWILVKSFGFQEEMLESVIEFAQNPDEDLIQEIIESFATKDIKYNFMIDCMMISSRDGHYDESKEEIIKEFFEMLKITEKESEDLKDIFEMFYTQDVNALYGYFTGNEYMKVELFEYLIGYYQMNTAYERLTESMPFFDGLMWTKESKEMTWYEAMEYAKNLRLGGYSDWRLPTVDELKEVVRSCGGTPVNLNDKDHQSIWDKNMANSSYQSCYDAKGFTSGGYWSSSPYVSDTSNAWNVFFLYGDDDWDDKSATDLVRCVRDSQ